LEFVMAPRAYWKGYLKLSLVSCPIALNPATSSSERVSFRQINKKTGNRLRQQLVDDETREPVEAEDKGKGYEVAKNDYMLIEDEGPRLRASPGPAANAPPDRTRHPRPRGSVSV
jgi:DNA end-binding protein Ku